MTLQAFRNFIARGELVGSAVLVVIGVALIVLAPPSVQRNGKVQATRRKELP
jgi:large-conductance mechanosensitive channel